MTEKTIIRQLFFGELHPWERFVTNDSDLRKASNRVGKLVEEWKEYLSSEDTERLEDIVDTLYQYSSMVLRSASTRFGMLVNPQSKTPVKRMPSASCDSINGSSRLFAGCRWINGIGVPSL